VFKQCKVYLSAAVWSTAVRKGPPEQRVSTTSVTSCTLYILHESEAQPKTATRIHLPIHLGSTLMKKIGGSPLSRAQGRVQRRILRRSRLGPEARQNMNNVYVRLLRRARTENKPPRLALLPLLKDEEGRWPRPVSVCGSIGSGSNFACSSLSSLSRLSLARSLARSLHPHKRTPTHTRLHTHTTENVGHGIAERGHRA
jgi:hypothetical protein